MMFLVVFFLGIFESQAVRLAMSPQNRVFVGASYADGGQGFSLGLESRLTQLIYVNMGGFSSLNENIGDISSEDQQDWVKMQHAVWAAPGWRFPHRYKEGAWNWDVVFRGGFACVFTSDANRPDLLLVDPAGLTGGDFYLKKNSLGFRWSNKLFFYQPELTKTLQGISVQRFQSAVEIFWEWE